jgi:hypothetical protein
MMAGLSGHVFKPHRHSWWWVFLALALVLLMGLTAVGCGAYKPRFGKGHGEGTVVVSSSGRYDFVVHLRGSPKLADVRYRLDRAKAVIAPRCHVLSAEYLYSHKMGIGPDGKEQLSYSVGVNCAPGP